MKLSFAISVCNEIDEIKLLLEFLIKNKRTQDEIVVLFDEINGTKEVREYLRSIVLGHTYTPIENYPFRWYSYDFDGHFGKMKNELTNMCTGDYIFQIDADEMPNEHLVEALPYILEINQDVDMFRVPRVNTVEGLTQAHIKKWGWNVNERGWVNWDDWQRRRYRRHPEIKWVNKGHEVLEGFKTHGRLPMEEEYALYHSKDIERQEKQNNYYDTL